MALSSHTSIISPILWLQREQKWKSERIQRQTFHYLYQISIPVQHLGKIMGEMVPWCRPGDHFGVYRVGLLTTQTKETFFSIPVSPTLLGFIFLKVVITM